MMCTCTEIHLQYLFFFNKVCIYLYILLYQVLVLFHVFTVKDFITYHELVFHYYKSNFFPQARIII